MHAITQAPMHKPECPPTPYHTNLMHTHTLTPHLKPHSQSTNLLRFGIQDFFDVRLRLPLLLLFALLPLVPLPRVLAVGQL